MQRKCQFRTFDRSGSLKMRGRNVAILSGINDSPVSITAAKQSRHKSAEIQKSDEFEESRLYATVSGSLELDSKRIGSGIQYNYH